MREKQKDAFIGVRVSFSTKTYLEKHCAELGEQPSVVIRKLIEQHLKEMITPKVNEDSQKIFHQKRESPDREPKIRFEILLTQSEKKALDERAKLEKCSKRRWIIDAIRIALTREPQFSMDEINVLGESNYQLLSIGRNLNQIAKRLNEGYDETVSCEQIESLRLSINQHIDIVSKAIRSSLERWDLE